MRSPCLAIVLCSSIIPISPAAMSQPATLDGTWNGGGTVILPTGDRERARCRATFKTRSANKFSGELYNPEYAVSGSIVIVVRGTRLTASVSGGGGMAQFTLTR